jgi:hypothetical protein
MPQHGVASPVQIADFAATRAGRTKRRAFNSVEGLRLERGLGICHETIRLWFRFEPMFAGEISQKRVCRIEAFVTGAGTWTKCT